jgi:amino acid transporter
MSDASSARRLTLLDCVGIGINGIIGSGIFLLPARVYAQAGGLSWVAWFAVGAVCLLVGLCFGEVASMTSRNGGPYAYCRDAYGESIGFAIGWMSLASTVLAFGAVARALGRNLSYLVPALAGDAAQAALACAIIAVLAALNWRGIKLGAAVSNLFSAAKLLPIFIFVAVGLFAVDFSKLSAPPPAGRSTLMALQLGGLAGLFACTGFEYVPVPAGETKDPQRAVPLALLGSLFGAMCLYALVQVVVVGTHPDLLAADKPLAEAAASFAGPWAARLITIGAVISSFGFCAGVALVGPRYLSAFAEDRAMPAALNLRHPRYQTPVVAILLVAVVSAALACTLDFDRLSDISNVALFCQYVPTCIAVLVLRRKRPDEPRSFRLPLGPVIPILGSLGCVLFLYGTKGADLFFAAWTLAGGMGLYLSHRWFVRPVSTTPPT